MPQTELKVVRCPNCNTAYNAAALPPGKGFRCKKCSTVVGGSAPAAAEEPAAPAKRSSSSRIDRKTSGVTSRRMKPEGRSSERPAGRSSERPAGRSSERAEGRARGGAAQQKSPMMWIVGGVFGVAIIGLVIAKMGGTDEKKSAPKKTEEAKAEQPKAEAPRPPDALDNDTAHDTDMAKKRHAGFNGQNKDKVDPAGTGPTDTPPPDPPKDHEPLDDDKPPDHKD